MSLISHGTVGTVVFETHEQRVETKNKKTAKKHTQRYNEQ